MKFCVAPRDGQVPIARAGDKFDNLDAAIESRRAGVTGAEQWT